jgi:hypothetical protein
LSNVVTSKSEYIERLQLAICDLHDCDAQHIETVPVREVFDGLTVWEGDVELFQVRDHPRAKKAYAWSYKDERGGEHMTAVLELPPVKTVFDAVRVSILAKQRE